MKQRLTSLFCTWGSWIKSPCLWTWMFLALLTIQSLLAQVPVAYPGFEAEGEIPEEFLRSVEQAYQYSLANQTDFSREQADFHLQNAYQVQQLLSSGKVLFNDDATTYLNMLAGQILRNRPELQENLRFFAVKSPEINAFATNDGLVLVNIGLLAHVEKEAQLAFILCHEISHYLYQHPLDIYLNGREQANSSAASSLPGESGANPSTRYTREKELEADRLGWELFLEAGYDPSAGLEAFDLVQQAGRPFASEPFDITWLNVSTVTFPESYRLDSVAPSIQSREPVRLTTHPDPDRRKAILEEFIELQNPDSGSVALLSHIDFAPLRLRCQYEVIRLQLLQRDYEQALYHTFCLERQHASDSELQRFKAVALYSIAMYANAGQLWEVHEDYLFVEGEQQRLNYLIEQLKPEELTAIALHHVWEIHRLFAEDEALRLMSRELMEALSNQYIETLDGEDDEVASEQAIFFPAMMEMMQDSVFAADIGKIMIRNRQYQDLAHTPMMRPSSADQDEPTLDLVGLRLGLERAIWIDPFYQVIRYQEEQPLALLESERKEKEFTTLIESYSQTLGFDTEMLSMHKLSQADIEDFSNMAFLQSWVEERSRHKELSVISPLHNEILALADSFDTPYFVWVGCIAQQEPRKGKGIVTTAGVLFPPLLPYSVWYLVTPKPQTLMYCMVYNATSGTYEVIYPHMIGMKDRPDVIRSATYDLLNQLSQN